PGCAASAATCWAGPTPVTCRSTRHSEATEMSRAAAGWLLAALGAAFLLGWLVLRPDAPSLPGARSAAVEFVRGNNADPESLDPLQARSEPALNILRDLHEGLTTLDASAQVVPGAARAWETSADGLEWRFELDPAA